MNTKSMDKIQFEKYYNMYSDMIYRLCYSYMKNATDAEDTLQETFIKLLNQKKSFESDEHVKAWLIVTATNQCKSSLTHWWRKNSSIDDNEPTYGSESIDAYEHNDVLDAIIQLPDKYKTVIFMYYYEGYSGIEIAKILHKPAGTVRSLLHDARIILGRELDNPYQKGIINEEQYS